MSIFFLNFLRFFLDLIWFIIIMYLNKNINGGFRGMNDLDFSGHKLVQAQYRHEFYVEFYDWYKRSKPISLDAADILDWLEEHKERIIKLLEV